MRGVCTARRACLRISSSTACTCTLQPSNVFMWYIKIYMCVVWYWYRSFMQHGPRHRRVAAEAFTGLLNPSRKSQEHRAVPPRRSTFYSRPSATSAQIALLGARLCVQLALHLRKIWALQVVRSAAAGWRMAPPKGAEWRTGWTGAACWRRTHRCKLFCCSTRLLPHPLRPPAPRDRRAWVHSFNQSRRGAALSRRR